MNKLILTRGLQGSGKTTFAEQWVAEDPTHRSRVNRDIIRKTYFNSYWGEGVDEETVSQIERSVALALMIEGVNKGQRDIIVDNTNVKESAVQPYLQLAEDFGYEVEFIDFNVPLEELLKRDLTRDKPVGAEVIKFYWDTYIVDGKLPEIPSL